MDFTLFLTQLLAALGFQRPLEDSKPLVPPFTDSSVVENPIPSYSTSSSRSTSVSQSLQSCGLSKYSGNAISTRIVGGRDVNIADFPWQVSIQKTGLFGTSHFCGGALINSNWVITAAHCLEW